MYDNDTDIARDHLSHDEIVSSNTTEAEDGTLDLNLDGEDNEDNIAARIAQDENGLEPHRRTRPPSRMADQDMGSEDDTPTPDNNARWNPSRREAELVLDRHPFVTIYPGGMAGAVHSKANLGENQKYELAIGEESQENLYAPFASQLDWEVARWAKIRGPGSTSFTELIALDGVS